MIWPRDCPLTVACRERRIQRLVRRCSISSFFSTPPRRDEQAAENLQSEPLSPQGACKPCPRSRTYRMSRYTHSSLHCLREGFANQLFALLPKRSSILWIESVATHSFIKHAQTCIICDDVTHMAVLAIPSSYLFGGANDSCPY